MKKADLFQRGKAGKERGRSQNNVSGKSAEGIPKWASLLVFSDKKKKNLEKRKSENFFGGGEGGGIPKGRLSNQSRKEAKSSKPNNHHRGEAGGGAKSNQLHVITIGGEDGKRDPSSLMTMNKSTSSLHEKSLKRREVRRGRVICWEKKSGIPNQCRKLSV